MADKKRDDRPDPLQRYREDAELRAARIRDLEWRRDHGLDKIGQDEARLVLQREIDALRALE